MITKEQTAKLFDFVRAKHVRYYDLQVELVDHLASGIEEKMASDPQVSFDDALQWVYRSFGIFGFGKIVMEKEAAVSRQSIRLWYNEFLHWFKWPKLLVTLLLFFVVWRLCTLIPVSYPIVMWAFISLAFAFCYHVRYFDPGLRKSTKLLMLAPFKISFFQIGYLFGILPLYFYLITSKWVGGLPVWLQNNRWAIALWIVLSLLLMISHVLLYRRMAAKAKQMYPSAFVA